MRAWLSARSPKSPSSPRSTWLGRLLRGRRFDRNTLRRGSDRAETVVLGVLLAAFVAGAPFAAHAAGSWTYAASTREAQTQRASLHQVPATLLQAPTSLGIAAGGSEAPSPVEGPGRAGAYRSGVRPR